MTKDQIALDIANDMKATMRSEAASFQADNKFAADLTKEIVTKESVLQFCGEGFSTAIFSLANLWNYTDLITSAGEKGLYMYLCVAVINDGISYMGIGDTYFEEMNKILDKYGDGDIVDTTDARNVIKYRFYGAEYYLCGMEMCMPFIYEYANGKTLSSVFGDSLFEGVTTSLGSFIIGDIFEFDDLADLWDLIATADSSGETITDYIKKNTKPQLDFTQIDRLLDMMTYTDDTDILTITSVAESVNSSNVNTHSTKLSYLFELSSNKSFGNVTIENELDLAGQTMTVNGDLYVKANVDINCGKLIVTGNLIQSGGKMDINEGILDVNGDYRIQTYEYNANTDKMEYVSSSGYLVMNNAKESPTDITEDIVKVKGNFYTQSSADAYNVFSAGTMEIGGDFKQINPSNSSSYDDNFRCSGSHKVVLNGTKQQHISFDNPSYSYFNYLKLTKDKEIGYIFDPDNCWKNLYFDSDIKEVTIYCIKDSLKQGLSMPIISKVVGINVPNRSVTWTIDGNTDADTKISIGGILTIGMNEQADKITVTATSVQDPTKSSSVEISINKIDPIVNGVVINPGVVSTVCGEKCSFGAMVYGLYNPPQTVIWTVTGNTSADTKISTDGILSIAEDETSDKLTVTATSTFDKTKSAQIDVTVMQIKITSTVDKVTVTMATGETQKLKAVVTGINNPDQNVVWSINGNNSKNTVISENGELTIGEDETSTMVIVKATSVEDTSKYGEFAIKIESDTTNGLLGEADGNGKINILDATAIQKHLVGLGTLTSAGVTLADADQNGKVNILDATAIQKYLVGLNEDS